MVDSNRIESAISLLEMNNARVLVTEKISDICYFCGCPYLRGALLIIENNGAHKLLVPSYSVTEALDTVQGVQVVGLESGMVPADQVMDFLPLNKKILIGEVSLPVFKKVNSIGPDLLLNGADLVQSMLRKKSNSEIGKICKAVSIAETGIKAAFKHWRVGASEMEIAAEVSFAMSNAGSEAAWFPPHVVTGSRSAYSDAAPTHRKLGGGEMGFIDVGPLYNNYAGDLTRSFVSGTPTQEQKELLELTLHAQELASRSIRGGVPAADLYNIAKKYFETKKRDEFFVHHLGHGLGLFGACPPWITKDSKDLLESGDVITLEPGLYVPGFGGCRIEDIYLVTDRGFDPISTLSLPWEIP